MSTLAPVLFDTHRFVKRMTEAGMPLGQAETLAEEQTALLSDNRAPRRDIEGLKGDVSELQKDVAKLKQDISELQKDVAELKQDVSGLQKDVVVLQTKITMVQWVVGGIGFGMVLLLARSFGAL